MQATITKSMVDKYKHKGGWRYRPDLEYSYLVKTANYTAQQLRIVSQLPSTETFAKAFVARYPVGSSVMAAYKPDDPAIAVL